jgi:hypothetical protein
MQAFGQLGNSVQSFFDFAMNPVSWTVPSWGQPQPTTMSAGGLHTCSIISTYAQCWGWNAFGQLGNGTTADTLTWTLHDTDKDGCTDAQELGPNHALGGQRDPTNFWDFFDTPDTTYTTLTGAFAATDQPPFDILVANGGPTAFPAGPDTLYIDGEKFSWDTKTSGSPSLFHITERALDGTTAADHGYGAYIVRNVRDRKVDMADYNRIYARYLSSGSTAIDPLSPPPPTPPYHTAFDRKDDPGSSEAWDLIGPDGNITIADLQAVTNQLNDSCQ